MVAERARITKATADRKQRAKNAGLRLEAAALEDRAASLTRSIAVMDEERTRLLIRATVLRDKTQEEP